jgi:iron complex outermembrane receptor protein
MKRRLCLAAVLCGVSVAAAQDKPEKVRKATAKELLRTGFFEDFSQLDISELLAAEVKTTVASRREEPVETAPGVLSVLTGEEIRNLGARTLEDVLRVIPGFDVVTTNLGRKQIVVRGAPQRQGGGSEGVLVLFNGHPLNEDLTGGATALNLAIPMDNVKQLEVLRGPGSASFGAGAVHAVVQIVTYSAEDFTGTQAALSLASFGTQEYALRVGQKAGSLTVHGFIRFTDSDGPALAVPADAQSVADRQLLAVGQKPLSRAPGRTDDDLRSLEVNYRVLYRDLEVNWRVRNERAGAYVGPTDILAENNQLSDKQVALDARYRRDLSGIGRLTARASHTRSSVRELLQVSPAGFSLTLSNGRLASFPSGVFLQTNLNTRRTGVEALLEHDRGDHRLTGTLSLDRESTADVEANGNLDYHSVTAQAGLLPLPGAVAPRARSRLGLAALDSWTRSSLTVTAGLRWDVLSDSGNFLSPRLAVVGTLPHDLTLRVLYGRAFRPPSFSELAFNLPGYIANPGLSPERVDTLQASATLERSELQVAGTVYLAFLRNHIGVEQPYSPLAPQRLVNLPGANLKGLEIEARRPVGKDGSFFLLYALQDPVDRGMPVAGSPTHLATLGATLRFQDRYTLTPTWLLRSARPRGPGDPRRSLGGYGVFSLHLRARDFFGSLELDAGVQDLFDRGYADPAPPWGLPSDYPRPGRRIFVNASFRL